jgi:hypothetical protein
VPLSIFIFFETAIWYVGSRAAIIPPAIKLQVVLLESMALMTVVVNDFRISPD